MSNRVLVVSFYFPPFSGPAAQHAVWFHRYLRDFGFDTVALTSSVYFRESANEPEIPDGVWRVPISDFGRRLSHHLHHAEAWGQARLRMWDRGFAWSCFAIQRAQRLLEQSEFTAMVSVSPSISSHWAAYWIKQRFPHLKWIADFQDPFLGNPFRRPRRAVGLLDESLERAIFTSASYISANTNTVQQMWRERYPKLRDRIIVTWGGYDPQEPMAARPLPQRPAPVLLHAGSVYGGRIPIGLFRSLCRLVRGGRLRPNDLVVEFFGPTDLSRLEPPDRARLEELRAGGWVVHSQDGCAPRREAIRVTEEADYQLLLDLTYPHNTKLQVPSKLFDYIRIGRPILAFTPHGSPTEFILSRSGIPHIALAPDDPPDQVDSGILSLLQLPATPSAASPWFLDTFDARRLAQSLADRLRA